MKESKKEKNTEGSPVRNAGNESTVSQMNSSAENLPTEWSNERRELLSLKTTGIGAMKNQGKSVRRHSGTPGHPGHCEKRQIYGYVSNEGEKSHPNGIENIVTKIFTENFLVLGKEMPMRLQRHLGHQTERNQKRTSCYLCGVQSSGPPPRMAVMETVS